MAVESIAWVGFSQGLFATILMFTKKKQTISDRVLSVWMLLFAIEFLTCALDYAIFGHLLYSSSFLLFTPALFIYLRALTEENFRFKPTMLLHLLPFFISETIAYVTQVPFSFADFFRHDNLLSFRLLFTIANLLVWLIYLPLCIRILLRYQHHLENEKSNITNEQNLKWLKFVTYFYTTYSIIAVLLGILFVSIQKGSLVMTTYNYSVLLLLIYIISFYGLHQQRLEMKTNNSPSPKYYQNSTLTDPIRATIRQKIYQHIERDRAYLQPTLSMDVLSQAIGFPKYQITEVLNRDIGKNFFQFVNYYRVEAVKKMLLKEQLKYSIEAIGYECGFSSKSSFYTIFKKQTGETPISFRNKNLSP